MKFNSIRLLTSTALLVGSTGITYSLPAAADGISNVEQVTVTARRRAEDVFDIPDSMIVVDAEKIERQRIDSISKVTTLAPNLGARYDLSPTSTFINIRGITNSRNSDPSVVVVVDGVQAGSASVMHQELFDIQQIEVLKGPQGSLYGRNAIGGAFNITTKKPSNEFEGKIGLGYGEANSKDGKFSFSGPLIEDVLLFRVAGAYNEDDGSIFNPNVNHNVDFTERETLRGRLIYEPTEKFSADFRLAWDEGTSGVYSHILTRQIGTPHAGLHANSNNFSASPLSNPLSVADTELVDTSIKLDFDFDFATLTSITAYNNTREAYGEVNKGIGLGPNSNGPGDLSFFNGTGVGTEQTYDVQSLSQELRLISNDDAARLRWNLGLYYINLNREDTLSVVVDTADAAGQAGANGSQGDPADLVLFPLGRARDINAWAVFGNVDFDVTDPLTVSVGLRYDVEDREQVDKDDGNAHRGATFDDLQPKFSAAYRLTDDHMVFATASRGFRSGGFNTPRTGFGPVFEKETLWSYEVGHKGRYFNDSVSVDLAAFYMDIENKQNFTFDAALAAQILYNIPESEIYGFEAAVSWDTTEDLTLGVAAGWMDSEITDFKDASLFPVNAIAAIGANSGLTLPVTDSFVEGNQLSNFSHWSVALNGDYRRPVTIADHSWELILHVDYTVRGDNYWNVFNIDKEKDVHLVNSSLSIEDGQWGLTLWAENIGDTDYWDNWFGGEDAGLPDIGQKAKERRFGATVTYDF
jgi:iron complex outermembrane recepter protein